jgi:APA family basic amino acid/polyamine antiporter
MRELARTLGAADLSLLVVGTVIGSGIFLVPGAALRQAGSPEAALLVWVVGGVLSVLGALTFGELGAMRPEAGGLYVHVREAFGPLAAFLYGWTLFFVMGSGSIATLAVAFSAYLGELLPLTGPAARAVAIGMIVVVTAINVRGTRPSAGFQNAATALKIGALLAMSAALLWRGRLQPAPGAPEGGAALGVAGLGAALVGVLWAYEGWQYATFSAGETRDPQRSFPLGIVLGTGVVVAIYLLTNLAYLAALGPERVARSTRVAAEAMSAAFGPAAGQLVALAILVSISSAANGLTLTAPRVYFAMARDGVFFRRLGEVHPRFGTPAVAVVGSAAWAILLAATGTFEQLLTYVVFAGWAFYALGGLAIFHYRVRRPDLPRPFRVPGYPLTPILFVLSAVGIVVSTFATHPTRGLVGTLMVMAGAPVFWLWKRGAARAVAP